MPARQAVAHWSSQGWRPPTSAGTAKAVNVAVISLDDAPSGYHDFDKGAAKKFVIDPHGMVA